MEEVTVGGATAFMYKALVAIKDLEETILTLLLRKGIPSKSTMAQSESELGYIASDEMCCRFPFISAIATYRLS